MKASKEVSVDLFIKHCINIHGLKTEKEIIDRAKEEKDEEGHLVKQLIREGKSEAYNEIEFQDIDCRFCGSTKMYDSKKEEYYCPMCD